MLIDHQPADSTDASPAAGSVPGDAEAPDGGPAEILVTTLGTCRINDPLAAVAGQLPMRRDLTNVYGFVHTSKEVLQQIDVLEGREIPQELVRFIAQAEYLPHRRRGPVDLFIVEISSLKEVHFRDFLLQINCFDKVFQDRRELFDTFFRFKSASQREARARALERLPSFHQADPVERNVLLEGHVRLTTREELAQDLLIIAGRLAAPVVFVSHIDVADNTGRMIESRSRLCGWLRELCAEYGLVFFDPAPQVIAYGRARALAEDGRDTNHYTNEYKPVLGNLLFETYALPLLRSRGALGAGWRPGVAPLVAQAAAAPPAVAAPAARAADAPAARAPEAPKAPAPETSTVLTMPTGAPRAAAAQEARAASAAPPPARAKGAAAGPGQEIRALIAEAKARIGRGEMDDAEVLLRGAAMDHPTAAEVFTLLGSIAYHRGDNTVALSELRHALQVDPQAIEPRMLLVKVAQRLNRHEEACTQALELVASVPDDQKALTVAAKALLKAKRYQEAASVWRRIAVLRPEGAAPLAEVARCELKGRNYDEAVKAADAALARDPREIDALAVKAEALQRTKRIKELAGVALQLAPVDPSAAMALVPALIAAAQHEDAAAVIAAVRQQGHGAGVAADPVMQAGLVRSLTQRARLAAERGDVRAAAEAWRAVQLIEPGNPRAASGIRKLVGPVLAEARQFAAGGDLPGAVAACRRGLELDPGNPRLLRDLAAFLERRGDWAGAASAWEALAERDEDAPRHLLRAARAAARAGALDEALRIYGRLPPDRLAEMGSTIGSLTRKLIKAMREDFTAGRFEDAVRKARVVIATDPRDSRGIRMLGKVVTSYRKLLKEAIALKDVARQEEYSRRIMDIDPNRVEPVKVLAKIYTAARRWREVIEIQEHLTQLEPGEARHWHKLASACRAARRYDLGVNAALRAVELEPGNAKALERLSDMLNRQALAA